MVENSLLHIVFDSGLFSGPLDCGPGSKEKFQSKDMFQLTCAVIKSPSQVGKWEAAATALSWPLMNTRMAAALAVLLKHFESHGAVAAALPRLVWGPSSTWNLRVQSSLCICGSQ